MESKTVSIVRCGVRRPNWVNSNTRQKAVLVRDASGSMLGQKAADASAASRDLVQELAAPSNKDGFLVAVIDFSGNARVVNPLEKATVLAERVAPIQPTSSTNFTAGLQAALDILQQGPPEEGIHYLRPVVIGFTDGQHNVGADPHEVAGALKEKADLVTVAFGTDANETLLRELATSPQHFYRCASGRELRSFLAAVGATLTATHVAKTNATQALASVSQQGTARQ